MCRENISVVFRRERRAADGNRANVLRKNKRHEIFSRDRNASAALPLGGEIIRGREREREKRDRNNVSGVMAFQSVFFAALIDFKKTT